MCSKLDNAGNNVTTTLVDMATHYIPTSKAQVKHWTLHDWNLQMSKIFCSSAFAFDLTHEEFDV